MKTTTILAICGLVLPLWISAQQTEDYLDMGDEGHFIRADPLNKYLSCFCKEDLLEKYVDTFCIPYWPDYTRYWELKDKRLYLVKIETDNQEVEYPLDLLFPQYDGSPIHAKWFSGIVSYRKGDSPAIQLNREFHEEESVVQFYKGVEIERFVTNHKDRWISYATRIMERYHPLDGTDPIPPGGYPADEGGMVEYLADVLSIVTNREKPSSFNPIIQVEFTGDLDGFQLTEAHRELSCYGLLKAVAEETQAILDATVTNRVVVYRIRNREHEPINDGSAAPSATGHASSGTPSE